MRITFILLAFLGLGSHSGSYSPAHAAPAPVEAPGLPLPEDVLKPELPAPPPVTLAEALKKGISGLDSEDIDRAEFNKQAKDYVQYKRGKMPTQKKLLWVSRCLEKKVPNPFCFDVIRDSESASATSSTGARGKRFTAADTYFRAPRKDPSELAEALTDADLSKFKAVSENSMHRALRLFPNWEPLQEVAEKALNRSSCVSVSFLTAMGQKAEEFFPDEKFKKLAIGFYKKVDQCANEEEAITEEAAKARFRLSLLYVWQDECRLADPVLQKLADYPDGDYNSRALYWRDHCAKLSGNKVLSAAVKSKLRKENPLSYHGLLMERGLPQKAALRLMHTKEPVIEFRSRAEAELNDWVRAVEALQGLKAYDLALRFLDHVADRLDGTEPEFKLYVSVLMSRAGMNIEKFKLLATLFRDDSSLISRSTLELFYPLKRFEVIRRHESRVDPYLVAALIRQESGFNERARSPAGAMGLMQLMPGTARRMERVSRRELYDAKTNIRLGVKFFYHLLNRFDGDAELALAAYNAGPERVDIWKRRYPTEHRMLFFDLIPYKETRDYVALISRNYYWYLSLYGDGDARGSAKAERSRKISPIFTLFTPAPARKTPL